MRIAFLHNESTLGTTLAQDLLAAGADELRIVRGMSSTLADDLRLFAPHLIVVATFPVKLPEQILRLAEYAAINVHGSLLPRYRGASPEFWVIRNGERDTGVTIHHMAARFDAGPILTQAHVSLNDDETMGSLVVRLTRAASPLLGEVLERYRLGERPLGTPQDDTRATDAPYVRDEHLRIDWTEPAASIDLLVRAAHPVLDPHTRFRREPVVVRSVKLTSIMGLRPGEARVDRAAGHLLVGTGDVAVVAEVLKFADGPPLTGIRFAERYRVTAGEACT